MDLTFMTKREFKRTASVYSIGHKIIVNPRCRTVAGLEIGMPLVEVFDDGEFYQIGEAVIRMLKLCFDNAPDLQVRRPPMNEPLFAAAGVKTWAALHKKAKSIECIEDVAASKVVLIPDKKVGRWSEQHSEKTRLVPLDPTILGDAVISALADAE